MTALHHTVQTGNLSTMKLLLKKGANPNIKNSYGGTIFKSCMEYYSDSYKKVILLLENGIDLEQKNDCDGKTAFLTLSGTSFCEEEDDGDSTKLDLMKSLVKYNANIHAKCNQGGNALWYASVESSEEMILYLNSLGLETKEIPNNAYAGSLFDNLKTSIYHKDYEYFKKHISQLTNNQDKIELFEDAICFDDVVVAKILIDEGIGPSDIRKYEESYLDDESLMDLAEKEECTNILSLFENL